MWSFSEARAGAVAVAPMLIGVVPFGLVAGAAPVAGGLGGWAALGLSTIVFAGASQLAAAEVLANGGSALAAILVAWTINLRMVLYSASLAPYLSHERIPRRLGAAYLLTDQAYALSVARWAGGGKPEVRLSFYLGAGIVLWAAWQAATIAGVLLGGAVPEDVPLDFAVPLVFLVLLVPLVTTRPAVAAAVIGGGGAVAGAELGAGPLSIVVGAALVIAAGTVVDAVRGRAGRCPGRVGP
ncbi:MAG TPA: AzlC family ABC transporter permease [Acidimicrobiales bacterium]|nr:AzlC family ABC transporter permease [Acidimicrobiales bacterium]